MDRVIRDGKVAVIYSPNYGSGWYSWNDMYDDQSMLFDPGLVGLIEAGDKDKIQTYITLKWSDRQNPGSKHLEIEWVPVGERFRIDEYDGSESVILASKEKWITA